VTLPEVGSRPVAASAATTRSEMRQFMNGRQKKKGVVNMITYSQRQCRVVDRHSCCSIVDTHGSKSRVPIVLRQDNWVDRASRCAHRGKENTPPARLYCLAPMFCSNGCPAVVGIHHYHTPTHRDRRCAESTFSFGSIIARLAWSTV